MNHHSEEFQEQLQKNSQQLSQVREAINTIIVGQEQVLDRIFVGILCGGHILLEGLPGLAKTTALKATASALALRFQRIQFTPDLLPADLVGTLIYQHGEFVPRKGPIFANFVLADEINRAPAKVQSALLEAMQERQVTLGDTTYHLEEPFLVMATQNPIEQEGTYPLPEAQTDRFLLKVTVSYPSKEEEKLILQRASQKQEFPSPVLERATILSMREQVRAVYLSEAVQDYIVDLVRATRNPEQVGLAKLKGYLEYGASPRASIALALAGRAHAFLQQRSFVTPDDIKALAFDVLRHRIVLGYEAEAERVRPDDVLRNILEKLPTP